MNKILLYPDGAAVLKKMLSSCGNLSCDYAVKQLENMEAPTELSSFQKDGQWIKPAFGNLQEYAKIEKIERLNELEVARYFGGKHHIKLMIRKAFQSHLGIEMGLEAGLVLDVLLPIVDGKYTNDKYKLKFKNFVDISSDKNLPKFYHRGLIINLDLKKQDINEMLKEQIENKEFVKALSKMKSSVVLPENFIESLKECQK